MNKGSRNIIDIKNLAIGYEKQGKEAVKVFDDISVSASSGELVALIGRNGVGKSTLLRTLSRLILSVSGDITLLGKDIQKYTNQEYAKLVGFVSTEIINVPNLKVLDLVNLGRFPYTNWFGKLDKKDLDISMQSLELVGMSKYAYKNITEISDGERQRVMIARTLAQDTDVIILDEPTAFLDLSNKYEIVHLLHQLAVNENKTILFSTHDVNIALREVDKVWLMLKDGIMEGAPEDLILSQKLNEVFDNSKLQFDKDKADFVIRREFTKEIRLVGSGDNSLWVQKALERLNYKVVDNQNCNEEIQVDENSNKILLKKAGKEFAFDSIYDLSLFLKTN